MTDERTDPATDETASPAEGFAGDPTDDRGQHASADVAPELFGW